MPHALGVGLDLHAGLDLARARGHQHARALDLDDAHAADVDRRERLEVAERRRVDAEPPAGVEDRRALGHLHLRPSMVAVTIRFGSPTNTVVAI